MAASSSSSFKPSHSNTTTSASIEDHEYCNNFPTSLLPISPSIEESSKEFLKKVDKSAQKSTFLEQVISHGTFELSEREANNVLDMKVRDKYITLGVEHKKLTGPKRSKFRKHVSSRQKKANHLFELSTDHEEYNLYLPLHELWKAYIKEMKLNQGDSALKFSKCDWHGAIVKVIKSTTHSIVGICGIILQETGSTFKVITEENEFKVLPKANTVFTIKVGEDQMATLYGNQLNLKSGDRSAKKWKVKPTLDIGT